MCVIKLTCKVAEPFKLWLYVWTNNTIISNIQEKNKVYSSIFTWHEQTFLIKNNNSYRLQYTHISITCTIHCPKLKCQQCQGRKFNSHKAHRLYVALKKPFKINNNNVIIILCPSTIPSVTLSSVLPRPSYPITAAVCSPLCSHKARLKDAGLSAQVQYST